MRIALALQLVGLVAITVGCAFIAIWLGLVVGGALCVLAGIALERGE